MNSRSTARCSCWLRWAGIIGAGVNAVNAALLDGAVDPTYRPPFLNPIADVIVLQPDGKSLVSFGSAGGNVGLVRLNTDGSKDATFNTGKGAVTATYPPGVTTPPTPVGIAAVALQSDGRIIVGGNFDYFDDPAKPRNGLARLSANGALDANFTAGNLLTNNQGRTLVLAVAVDDTDRIYVGGKFTAVNKVNRSTSLIRLKADGTLDNTFVDVPLAGVGSASIDGITIQPDQKVLIATTYRDLNRETTQVLRLMPNGGLDPTFQKGTGFSFGYDPRFDDPLGRASRLPPGQRHLLLPSGQILVTTQPSDYFKYTYNGVAITGSLFRLSADGVVDPNFKGVLLKLGDTGLPPLRMAAAKDGRIYVAGGFEKAGNVYQDGLIRLLADGSIDPTFVPESAAGGIGGYALAVQPDGKVIAQTSVFDGALKYGVVRLVGDSVITPPTLKFQFVGGTTLQFTIPVGYHLERSSSLSPPDWGALPATGTADVPITGLGAYFRLAAGTP